MPGGGQIHLLFGMYASAGMCSVLVLLHTKAGDVSVQSDIFQVPLSCLHLQGVTLSHVVHGKHGFLTELGVVIEVDFSIKANH